MDPGRSQDVRLVARCLTLWANHYLELYKKKTVITDLFYDLRSGELLLDLLVILFSCDSSKDSGQLTVGKLNNLTAVLAILQRERVSVDTELVTAGRILQGEVEPTLAEVPSQHLTAGQATPQAGKGRGQ